MYKRCQQCETTLENIDEISFCTNCGFQIPQYQKDAINGKICFKCHQPLTIEDKECCNIINPKYKRNIIKGVYKAWDDGDDQVRITVPQYLRIRELPFSP